MKNGDELEIEIGLTGEVRVLTRGVKGKRCLEYAEIFAAILGRVEDQQLTPEYNQVEAGTEVGVETHSHVQTHVRHS
jgi:hypothetical protein